MATSEIAISVRGLSKSYTIAHNAAERHVTLAESLLHRLRHPFQRQQKETFWALRDLEFDIKKGDVVGIIGRNGAGKSTLLKILSRITEPTAGQIDLYGRVGSLLEVGTGFHPELTGRENIFLNGAILGMNKAEIRKQFDAIVDFAGVEQFLDTPVKRYSSGMYVRLAFAVAAHLESEILIVDEVLAVGDADFQRKCMGKMKDVAQGGRTVLFVSHNMSAVLTLCSHALHLKRGQLGESGRVDSVVERYATSMKAASSYILSSHEGRKKGSTAAIREISFEDESGTPTSCFRPNQLVVVRLALYSQHRIMSPSVSIGVNNARGERIFAVATYLSPRPCPPFKNSVEVSARFQLPAITTGLYTLDIGVSDGPSQFVDSVYSAGAFEVIDDNYLGVAFSYFNGMGPLLVRSEWAAQERIA